MPISWPAMESRGPVVTEADVVAFEQRIGYSLPEDYRRFLLEVNGGRLAVSNTRYAYACINMMLSLNDPDESNDLLTWALRERARSLLPGLDLLTVGYDDGGGGILIALAGEHQGEVWFENTSNPRPVDSNPRVLWFERRDMKKLADSFEQFMGSLQPRRRAP